MMVKAIHSFRYGSLPSFAPGEERHVSKADAEIMIKRGLVTAVKPVAKVVESKEETKTEDSSKSPSKKKQTK